MDPILDSFVRFSTTLTFRDLPPSIVASAGRSLLDAAGCAVGAYDGEEGRIARSLAGPAAKGAQAGRIVGSMERVAADAAAFANTSAIRTRDFNDTYLP